jgi:protease I
MAGRLAGKKIACLATDGFEYAELVQPKEALEAEGATVDVISTHEGEIEGETKGERAGTVAVDERPIDVEGARYDALLLPGGVKNPDRLRVDGDALMFVKHFVMEGKPIAAICHGPWTLINAGGVRGKQMTSWPSLKMDLENAGARWIDKEVVRDGNLVTSRHPGDLPAFIQATISLVAKEKQLEATTPEQDMNEEKPPASAEPQTPSYYEAGA